MITREYTHQCQNNLNRPRATEKHTHQCQNNLVTDLRLTELVDKIQDTYKYRSTLLFTRHNNNKKYTKYTKVPKQSRNRPMVILQVYLAPKQSRNRPMITREYTSVPKQSKQT